MGTHFHSHLFSFEYIDYLEKNLNKFSILLKLFFILDVSL